MGVEGSLNLEGLIVSYVVEWTPITDVGGYHLSEVERGNVTDHKSCPPTGWREFYLKVHGHELRETGTCQNLTFQCPHTPWGKRKVWDYSRVE